MKKTLILSLSGCVGVVLTMALFTQLTVIWLHTLLLAILCFNLYAITRTWWRNRRRYQARDVSMIYQFFKKSLING